MFNSVAALQFDARWRILPGASHGLGQPTMLGRAVTPIVKPADMAALDQHMAQFITQPPPTAPQFHDSATMLVERALFWAAALQRQNKVPVFHGGRCWRDGQCDDAAVKVLVAMAYVTPAASQAAVDWVALAIGSHLAQDGCSPAERQRVADALEQLKVLLSRSAVPGVNMFRFLAAADALDIPARQVAGDVYCFGSGRSSRWLESSYTDRTSVVGSRIARDKVKTSMVLRQAGLPVAPHARVASPAQAADVARQLGYPVVVKPADLDQGLGVAADLRDDAAVVAAFHAAAIHSRNILVEKHFHGQDYRMTVLDGRVIKTIVRQAGGVTGDGLHNIADLVVLAGQSLAMQRRTMDRGQALLNLDKEALDLLSEQGLGAHHVPAAGRHVPLRRRANVSAGGTPTLVTGPIHPDNLRLAERAAAALRLDLAGIDLIVPDIAVSWFDSGAIICEVNGQPQIGSSTSPGIYKEILGELLPGPRRMTLVLVVGEAGGASAEMVRIAGGRGRTWGRSGADGVWQGTERLTAAQAHSFAAAQILMGNQEIDGAVISMSLPQILMFGLPFDRCDVVVVAEPASEPAWSEMDPATLWRSVLPPMEDSVLMLAGPGRLRPPTDGTTGIPAIIVDPNDLPQSIVELLIK